MSFDGILLRHLTKELSNTLTTGRINKIYQISKYDLIFNINTKTGKKQLLISSSPSYARIHLTTYQYEKPLTPPTFCMFLRKHLENGIIDSITQIENDRIIIFRVQKRNELGDMRHKNFIFEVMGRHSNIIVTDEDNKILESIKHTMPFENPDRTVFPGAEYVLPKQEKVNPFNEEERATFTQDPSRFNASEIQSYFQGVSPIIAKEIMYQYEINKQSMNEAIENVITTVNPHLYQSKRDLFSYTNLDHLDVPNESFETVNILLDRFYYNRDKVDIIKQKSKDYIMFVKNAINRIKNKIEKLNKDLKKADKQEELKMQGELIKANLYTIQKGDTSLTCTNYYTNKEVTIMLDPKLNPIENSEKYFKKYKKLKTSIPYINHQIKESENELNYFIELLHQIETASLKDIEEIKEELEEKRYIKRKTKVKKRKNRPNFDTYIDPDGVTILVGKNNIQNEFISHKLAKHNEVWFHVKNSPGSHVVVRQPFPLSETTIRTAAQLASYHSKMKNSSSVPVDYLEIRYLKKVPGKINSFVTYTNNKTIYIDPDESYIHSLTKK